MAFVYILGFPSGKFYIGSTVDLADRIAHHVGRYTPSTKRLGTITLLLAKKYSTLKDARSVEYKLKKLKRHDYIAKMVADGYIKIVP